MTDTVAHNRWYLYILRTATGALYTGITTDIPRRLAQHQAGRGAKALRGKGPLTLAFHAPIAAHAEALSLEYQIKRLNKKQKERLVIDQPLSPWQWLTENGQLTSSGKYDSPEQNALASAATPPYPVG
ncbi:GIY-YIG nuclease family protein [Edwardsiella hoshinae]|uniref:GIY-YIG nuclease superfamily protein n=1 Tax=Edwardsiella hoshinae TaxID=93378 RepID=A0A376DLI9_9GAMM|nr:GIY-YIG nuclease family protein [Edwardsiella hoshinae]QPR29063.1 GIY-YIG nuclease family protein [Edwardsiella hoshinae]STC91500.1 GIY-YIG nuclease superfamily protein [Edwardsiella hoshinae]